jgi:predicted O-linked N-acetylglucosamine transferase (SPINDLY family)
MLRRTLREQLRNSPLMDAPRFARHVEAAYRHMWERFCQKDKERS